MPNRYSILLIIVLLAPTVHYASGVDSFFKNRFDFHFQTTIINQNKLSFQAPYTGENSLRTQAESRTSITGTLYAGLKLWKNGFLFVNPEIAGGSGLSEVLGLGDATNGETFRIGNASPQIYLARCYYQQFIPFNKNRETVESELNQFEGKLPTSYLSFSVGKISLADYLDKNTYSHDPRTQFSCWGLMSAGAWDYAANTRGYTQGLVVEIVTPKHEWRTSLAALPLSANGNDLNMNYSKAAAFATEYTFNYEIKKSHGSIRLLGFYNTANMGNYNQSIQDNSLAPDITSSRQYGRNKYGYVINWEQALNNDLGIFSRWSWNDGNNEIWAFTQIDHSFSGGLVLKGNKWKRPNDKIGIAHVASGLSMPHQNYLKQGGKDFMLGDGNLSYAPEHVTEMYYATQLKKDHIYVTGAYQCIVNPGFNKDRTGPVYVFSIRLHIRL